MTLRTGISPATFAAAHRRPRPSWPLDTLRNEYGSITWLDGDHQATTEKTS